MNSRAVRIVVRKSGTCWQVLQGDALSEHPTETAALSYAIDCARMLASEGEFSAVIMRVITAIYGPDGFFRCIPTRKAATQGNINTGDRPDGLPGSDLAGLP